MRIRDLLFLPLLALMATTAWAQEDDLLCRNGLFPNEASFALARVAGTDKAYFHEDMNGCPWEGEDCAMRAYVVPGDTVIISRIRRNYACTFYPGRGGGTAGWIRTRQLAFLSTGTSPPQSAWLGKWSAGGNPSLRFRETLGRLHVEGEAFWPGPPGTTDWPSVHVGEIAGPVALAGQRANYEDGESLCEVRFTLVGPYLVAGDNNQCGGANVSFSAVYRRAD